MCVYIYIYTHTKVLGLHMARPLHVLDQLIVYQLILLYGNKYKLVSNMCNAHESLIKYDFIFYLKKNYLFSFILYINIKFENYDSY